MANNRPPLPILEHHLQTVLTGLILAVLVWVGTSITGLQKSNAILEVEVRTIQEKVALLNEKSYSVQDAAAQLQIRDLKIERLEERISRLEQGS